MKFYAFALVLFAQSASAATLVCNVVETPENGGQTSYQVKANVTDTDGSSQIQQTGQSLPEAGFDVFGCTACSTRGTEHLPEINIRIQKNTSIAYTMVQADHAMGMLTFDGNTVSLDCAVAP
jgi:hypothetical protein